MKFKDFVEQNYQDYKNHKFYIKRFINDILDYIILPIEIVYLDINNDMSDPFCVSLMYRYSNSEDKSLKYSQYLISGKSSISGKYYDEILVDYEYDVNSYKDYIIAVQNFWNDKNNWKSINYLLNDNYKIIIDNIICMEFDCSSEGYLLFILHKMEKYNNSTFYTKINQSILFEIYGKLNIK